MKKIIGIMLFITLLSCKKEKENCNCGLVLSDNVSDYSVVIRNDCSKNEKRFVLQPDYFGRTVPLIPDELYHSFSKKNAMQ